MPVRNRLVLMAKRPSAGRVKTRLARDIGTPEALRFYRHQLVRTCRELARDPRWELVLARSPDHGPWSPHLPVDRVVGQEAGGLGARMQRLFENRRLRRGGGPLILIGADIPGITRETVARAFWQLKSHDFVFGPAEDGGYWLVGQRRFSSSVRPFAGVRWSGPMALSDTLANLRGCSVSFVDRLNDIDTGADMKHL